MAKHQHKLSNKTLEATKTANNQYADIIHLERPVSAKYPHMSITGRAAQFAPYKTITVYHDQIDSVEAKSSATCDYKIIPDVDYFEYADEFCDPEYTEEGTNNQYGTEDADNVGNSEDDTEDFDCFLNADD